MISLIILALFLLLVALAVPVAYATGTVSILALKISGIDLIVAARRMIEGG